MIPPSFIEGRAIYLLGRRLKKRKGPTLFDFLGGTNETKKANNKITKNNQKKRVESKTLNNVNKKSALLTFLNVQQTPATKSQRTAELTRVQSEKSERQNVTRVGGITFSKRIPKLTINMSRGSRDYSTLIKGLREARENGEYYILQVVYDGQRGKAVVLLYDVKNHEVVEWVDTYGHKPYFLTDLEPHEIKKIGIPRQESFAGMDIVYRYDLLHKEMKKLTKIYTHDPLAVRKLREMVPVAWEAKIKYHDNYTYDLGIIPLIKYTIRNNKLKPIPHKITQEEINKVMEAFKEESDEFKQMAIAWIPIFEATPPEIKAIAIDIEVFTPSIGRIPDAEKAPYPITSVAMAGSDGLKKVLVLLRDNMKLSIEQIEKLKEQGFEIEFYDNERALILEMLRIIRQYPVLLTYNGDNFDLNYIFHRLKLLGIPEEMNIFKKTGDMFTIKHGIHIDLYQFYDINAIKTYAFGNKYKEVNLDAVASALLGEHKVQITKSISELSYDELVIYNFRDAKLTLELLTFNSWLPWKLMVLISRISKLGIEDVTRKQVSAWIKNLFFWEHRRRRYLIPNKEDIVNMKGTVKSAAVIKGKRYQGAFVFEPVAGIFFNVVVLDFASLYPTIIKKYNISYETVNEPGCKNYVEAPEVGHKICQDREGITPLIVGLLRDYRVKIYKKKAKDKSLDAGLREWYNTVQSAMKVYINASYGVLGADSFELYCPPAAESITAFGRHAIRSTMKYAEKHGLVVLYGDTDSMFLWSPPEDRLNNIIKWVKENFGLEIEIDKVYRFVAFTGLKKNYIGVYPDGSIDVKGLLGKKRNTPLFVKQTFTQLIDMIRAINTPEEVVETRERVKDVVKQLYTNLRRQYYDLDELAFHMQLTKPLEAYTKNMPQHVKAAKMLKKFGLEIGQGDVISFVKVKGAEGVKPVQLAKLPELDLEKYFEVIETTLGQILKAFSIDSAYLSGTSKLEAFLMH